MQLGKKGRNRTNSLRYWHQKARNSWVIERLTPKTRYQVAVISRLHMKSCEYYRKKPFLGTTTSYHISADPPILPLWAVFWLSLTFKFRIYKNLLTKCITMFFNKVTFHINLPQSPTGGRKKKCFKYPQLPRKSCRGSHSRRTDKIQL